MGIETDLIQEEIKDIIIKTFLAVQPQLSHEYKSWLSDDIDGASWFEILGFDIMLDDNLDPYLIEINHAPAFGTDSKLDYDIKSKLLSDSFRMLNMSVKRKIKYKRERNKVAQNRIFNGRKEIITQEEKDMVRKIQNLERHHFEIENKGNYELLYPLLVDKNVVGNEGSNYIKPEVSNHKSDQSTSNESK